MPDAMASAQLIGQALLDRNKRRVLLQRESLPNLDDATFVSVKEKLRLIDELAEVKSHEHFRPLSFQPVRRQAVPASASRYSRLLRFVSRRRGLVIQYTKQCDIRCAHCLVAAAAHRHGRIDRTLLREILREGRRQGYEKVMFTGGEVFVHRDDLMEDLAFAQSVGYTSSVGTNGLWGRSPEAARTTIDDLYVRGVRRISLSTGEFHRAFVPFRHLRNIIMAARSCPNLEVQVKIAGARKTERMARAFANTLPEVAVRILPMLPAGRAKALPQRYFAQHTTIHGDGVCLDVCRPLVDCEGVIWRCCNIDDEKLPDSHFSLGCFHDTGLPDLRNDRLRRLLFLIGPMGIARWLWTSGFDVGSLEDRLFASTCDFCNELLNSPEYALPVSALLATPDLDQQLDELERSLALPGGLLRMLNGGKVVP